MRKGEMKKKTSKKRVREIPSRKKKLEEYWRKGAGERALTSKRLKRKKSPGKRGLGPGKLELERQKSP